LRLRWQRAVEQVADVVIDPEELPDMNQADIVKTALITLKANIEKWGGMEKA